MVLSVLLSETSEARGAVFYPGITKDIKNRLASCDTCQTFQKAVDYLSGYFEIDRLESERIQDVIYCLKVHMMRYGKCDELISDNSPFQAAEFKRFAELYEFKHITSSPRYPISDGRTELAVVTCKKIVIWRQHMITKMFILRCSIFKILQAI